MTVARPGDDGDELAAGPEGVELLELVDADEVQDLGHGLAVDATVARPAPRRKRDTNIPPPRRWARVGTMELRSCPQCHTVVANVKEGFWHQQAEHGGETPNDIDMDEWGEDLQAEVQEYRQAIRAGKARIWRGSSPDVGVSGSHMAAAIIGVMVFMALLFVVYVITQM